MESQILNVLFDFNILIDTDIGCIQYMIKSDKFDPKYLKPKVRRASLALLKNMVISNKDINPLKIVLKDEYHNSADDIWKELKEKHYNEIVEHSLITDVFKLSNNFNMSTSSGIICSYSANNDIEYDTLKKLFKTFDVSISNQNYDTTQFNIIYLSKYTDLDKYQNIKHVNDKKVYIVNRACNITENRLVSKFKEYFPCAFNLIDLYKGFGYMEE